MKGSDYLKELREQGGLSQRQLASNSGLSNATISRLEKGTVIPDINTISSLAKALHVKRARLLEAYGYIDTGAETGSRDTRIPVYGRIPAGELLEAAKRTAGYELLREEWLEDGNGFFAIRVSDDSMSPKYTEGDIVILRKQAICESGADAVVFAGGDDAVLRRVVIDGGGVILQPINPSYPPSYYPKDAEGNGVRILGAAIELRRRLNF